MPLRPASRLLLPLCLALAAGCADRVTGFDGSVALVTSASDYVALRDGQVGAPQRYLIVMVAAVTNDTDRPISIQSCADADNTPRFAVSMARIRNDFSSAYENAWSCRTPSYIELAVGESRVDRIELIGPRSFDAYTGEALGDLEGRMRLVYYVNGITVWSNAFDVVLETPAP